MKKYIAIHRLEDGRIHILSTLADGREEAYEALDHNLATQSILIEEEQLGPVISQLELIRQSNKDESVVIGR